MTLAQLATSLSDIVAIPVTPYAGETLAIDDFQLLLRRLVDNSIQVITPNGNTSEFYALNQHERLALIEATTDAVATDAHVLVGIGLDLSTAIEEASAAFALGVRMAMIHQPVHPHVSREGWLDYHAQIAEALPDMGFVLYIRNSWVTADLVRELGERCPNVIGIKYAVSDAARFGQMRDDAGADRFVWIAGLAEPYALSYAAHGATGFTSGLVNVNPKLSIRLRDALRAEDYATSREILRRINRFEELRAMNNSANNVSIVKEALAQLGLCGREIRPPSHELTPADRDEVAGILSGWMSADDLTVGPASAFPAGVAAGSLA
jgi:4-hydroxy-tetrahydrodipicolinate synthase